MILAASCIFAVSMSGQPNKGAARHKDDSSPKAPSTAIFVQDNEQCSPAEPHATGSNPPKWYAPIKRPEWWLVVAAFVTLGIIARQTVDTRRAAEAALQNAQAVIRAERPWIVVKIDHGEANQFSIKAKNVGRTPAKIVAIYGEIIFLRNGESLPVAPPYGRVKSLYLHPRLLAPEVERVIDVRSTAAAWDAAMADVGTGAKRAFIIGMVAYLTAFADKKNITESVCETKWCYMLMGRDGPVIPSFCPPAYEDFT